MSHQMEKSQLIEQILLYFKHVKEKEQIVEEIESYKNVEGRCPYDVIPFLSKGLAYFVFVLVAFLLFRNISNLDVLGKLAQATMEKFDNQLGEMISNILQSAILKWIFVIIYIWIMYSIARMMDSIFDGIYSFAAKKVKKMKEVYIKERGLQNLKENQHLIQELVRKMKEKDVILRESRIIPIYYLQQDALSKFLIYLESGRCDTLKECIDTYETDRRYEELLSEVKKIKKILNMEEIEE